LERCPDKTECYWFHPNYFKDSEYAYVQDTENLNVNGRKGKTKGPEEKWILVKVKS